MAPKRAPRMKKSSKSGFFSQPKTMLENRAQTIGKTQKMNSNKSSKSEQSYSIQSRPGGLREALTIRPPPLLAKGSLGVLRSKARVLLVFNPSKSLPGSSAQSALPFVLRTPLVTFFFSPLRSSQIEQELSHFAPHKLQKWHPNLGKSAQQTCSKNTCKKQHVFESFWDPRTRDPLAQAQSKHVFPFSAPHTKNSPFWPHFRTPNPLKIDPEPV